MPIDPPAPSPLVDFLKRNSAGLYGKLAELRAEVKQWLTYIPQTFGHYTSHTIDHSDEIILQISKLLFEPKKTKPAVDIGPVAAYILAASSYLHDAGMVAADEEKAKILISDEWREWVSEGGATARWKEIENFRKQAGGDALKHFALDRATRLLIAEFIRKQHHRRAGEFVRNRALELGRVDIGDPILRKAIADICIAHGLDHSELEDDGRFPEATDIQGERVNLRLLATLLRLGDLLDLRTNRACPLLLQAACPLPADSIAHWTQYQAIESRLTAPRKIEIRAKCRNHEEHRVLADWCTWIVREVDRLQARLPTTEWRFPHATMAGQKPTITVDPVPGATYIPAHWTFELEQDAIFQRLISDVYDTPNVFLREVIQNALDATRCRLYQDLKEAGQPLPSSPDQATEDILERYKISISLREEEARNDSTNENERVYTLIIDDQGIGMDREIIERYLLQVGRSYYTTADFRRSFPFPPTSRFGIGFLSVFSASDHITLETYKPTSPRGDGPLRLKLTGPRNYILLEKGNRTAPGTRIEIRLKKKLSGSLEHLVRDWCVLAEFPIEVSEPGAQVTVRRLKLSDLEHTWTDPLDPALQHVRKFHPIQHPGIAGGFVTVSRIADGKERWLSYHKLHDLPLPVEEPLDRVLLHGIRISPHTYYSAKHLWKIVDWRKAKPISMRRLTDDHALDHDPEVLDTLRNIVEKHIGPDNRPFKMEDWLYLAELISDDMDLSQLPIWNTRNDVIPIWRQGNLQTCSVSSVLSQETWFIGLPVGLRENQLGIHHIRHESSLSKQLPDGALLLSAIVPARIYGHYVHSPWARIFNSFIVTNMRLLGQQAVAECKKVETPDSAHDKPPIFIKSGSLNFDVAAFGHTYTGWLVINTAHPFGVWYKNVYTAGTKTRGELSTLLDKIDSSLREAAAIHYRPTKELFALLHAWNAGKVPKKIAAPQQNLWVAEAWGSGSFPRA